MEESLSDNSRSQKRINILETGDCERHEQRVYATHEFGAQKKMMNILVLIADKSDEEKEIRMERVLCCLLGCSGNKTRKKWHLYSLQSAYRL